MSFKEFLANLQSVRDYKEDGVNSIILGDIKAYLGEINTAVGREKGFSFVLYENGSLIFSKLEGVGGYSGVMIKSPHYIGLTLSNDKTETEFLGAYFMQSIVKKIFDMDLGSCWINIRNVPSEVKATILNDNSNINYLLAFGKTDAKALKQKSASIFVQNVSKSYKTDPYGTVFVEPTGLDKARLAVGDMVYLHEWGKKAPFEELENRGLADLFLYVRNAPSYKNIQPCRFILKDGEAFLAIIEPQNKENYVDAGIMMYTTEGLAKDLGIPGKWSFLEDTSQNNEYKIVAKIEL